MNRIAAFVLAPVPAAALGGFTSWATGAFPRPFSVAAFYLLQLYALELIFGLVIYAYLRRTGRNTMNWFSLGGLLMVALAGIPYLAWASSKAGNTLVRTGVVLSLWLAFGAITGATAWLLLRRGASASIKD